MGSIHSIQPFQVGSGNISFALWAMSNMDSSSLRCRSWPVRACYCEKHNHRPQMGATKTEIPNWGLMSCLLTVSSSPKDAGKTGQSGIV